MELSSKPKPTERMNFSNTIKFLLLLTLALPACTTRSKPAISSLKITSRDYDATMLIMTEVLKQQGFAVDDANHRYGHAHASPRKRPAGHLFEVPTEHFIQSNLAPGLNNLRRIASIRLIPDQDKYLVDVRVYIQKEEVFDRQLTLSRANARSMRPLAEFPRENIALGVTRNYWRPLRRDTWLEQTLLNKIKRKLSSRIKLDVITSDSPIEVNPLLDLPPDSPAVTEAPDPLNPFTDLFE